jgi:hypothetical protein
MALREPGDVMVSKLLDGSIIDSTWRDQSGWRQASQHMGCG